MTLSIVDENTLNRTSTETWEQLGLNPNGDPRDVWDADSSDQIEGFATDISVNHGTTVEFKINVNANPGEDVPYHIEIYRLGYYGGDGATLVYQSGPLTGNAQPDPMYDPATGMVDAGNWSVSTGWAVPADATSGVYLVKMVRDDNNSTNQIPFIVRDDDAATKSDIVLQTSDTTWHAYNGWGGNNGEVKGNFYGDPSGTIDHEDVADPGLGAQDRAYAVSYNRPFLTRDGGGAASGAQDYLFGADYAAIYFLEKNGYDVSYISGVDTDRLGADYLIGHKAFISVGHDEYWSGQQRFNVEEARDAGVNLLFWSGNEVYWKTRLEASTVTTDDSPTDYRTLVCYKETWANRNPFASPEDYADIDPANDWTGTWRDMRFVDSVDEFGNHIAGGSRFVPLSGSEANCSCITGAGPENSLTGQLFGPDGTGEFGAAIDVPAALAGLRVWRDTSVAVTGQLDIAPGILGYEWNISPEDQYRPEGLIYLSDTVDVPWSSILIDQGNLVQPGVATHNLSLYRAESGALVFGAGTVFWSWGLSDEHDSSPYGASIENVTLKQFTLNMFADMGIQPGVADAILTSQGLVRATMSTDYIAPTTTISVLGPTEVTEGQIVTITGTATDNDGNPLTDDGQVAAIEVSTDNGVTWHPVSGTTNWTYSWQAQGPGNHTIKARAVDDSVNLQTSNIQSVELSVMAEPESHLFSETDLPAGSSFGDEPTVELGVKFQASTSGFITTLLFYKAAGETGEHDGHLWTSDGTLLATVDFEAETASGWQTAILDTPIAITANTTYVASYHANVFYAFSANYFTTAHVNGSLTALAAGPGEPNGIYHYYASPSDPAAFPDTFFGAPNYWVDVGFVAFTGENFAPEITSGSGNTDIASVFENTTFVTIVTADDQNDGQFPVFSIVGGADGAFFQIDPNTGLLTFINAPNFESHADADGDNVYEVTVQASDSLEPGTLFDQQTISVTVTDTVETGFEGHEVKAEYIFGDDPDDLIAFPPPVSPGASQTAVVDVTPGAVEFSELPFHDAVELGNGQYGLARVDLEETTILVEFTLDPAVFGAEGNVTFSNPGFNGVRISDFGGTLDSIVGVSIIDQAGLATPLTLANLIVTADSIFINCNGNNRQVDSDLGTPGIQPTFVLLSVNFNDPPIIISDGGGATATIQGVDGQTLVTTLAATDADNVPTQIQTLTLSVAGGEDGSLFQILNGNELHFITAPDFQSPPPAGATPGYQVLVQVSDGAGGIDTQLITVNLDNDADEGDDSAVSISEDVINAAEVGTVEYTVSGVDPDATAEVTFTSSGGGTPVVVSGLGNGTTNVDLSSLPDGTISASIVVTDNASNTASGTGDIASLDTIADAAPVASVVFDDGDGFVSASEAATASYTIAGVDGDATATVTFSDGNPLHDVTVPGLGNGSFSADLSGLTDGPITASISVTDTAGNSTNGTGDTSTKDTTADAAPSASVTFNDGDGFVSAAETATASYTIAGVDGDATATVTFSDGNPLHDVMVAALGNGGFSVDLSGLSDGPISASIVVSDTAGNSAPGTGDTSIKDMTADSPADLAVTINDGDGFVSAAEAATVSYTITGVDADATATVTFSDGNPLHDVVVPDLGNGGFTADLSGLTDGAITVSISATDTAGNSANGTGDSSTKDTVIDTPTVMLTNDSGSNGSDLLTNDAALTFSAGAGDVTRSFIVDGGAPSASYTAPTGQGGHTVQVIDTDAAGNTANASITFTLDSVIATPTMALTNDSGTDGDLLTNDASLAFSAGAGDVTRSFIVDGGAPSASYTAPTGQGGHTVQVIDTDAAGNTVNASITFTLDTSAPNAPTILLAEDNVGSETGNLLSGATTDDRRPVLRIGLNGTNAVAGDSVQIFNGVNFLIAAAISANDLNNHYVSVTLPELADDIYDFTAKVIDVAGNTGDTSGAFALSVEADTGFPPTDIFLTNSSVLENRADALLGTLSAADLDVGDTFTFTLLDDAGGRFAIDGNSLRTTGPLDFEDEGIWTIDVQVTDSANNTFHETMNIQVGNVSGFTIKGSQGNDVISVTKTIAGQHKATGEEDTILGRGGNDRIDGAGGNDTIRGGVGDDKIIGGLGVDLLIGNAGADKFIFRSVAESLVGDADTINGFSHSQHDKIDLHLIDAVDDAFLTGNQAFTFIGNADFSGLGAASAGQLHFDAVNHKVEGDINGDGTADFAISVNVANLVSGDFIL